MRKQRCAVFLFVFVSFGLMWAVPATDISETAYDESEGLTYQSSSRVVIGLSNLATNLSVRTALNCCRARRSQPSSSRVAKEAPSRAALCSLLC